MPKPYGMVVFWIAAFPRTKAIEFPPAQAYVQFVKEVNDLPSKKSDLSHLKGFISQAVDQSVGYFPSFFANNGVATRLRDILIPSSKQNQADYRLRELLIGEVVGLDLVGDELGFPYSPFLHPHFTDIIKAFRKENDRFGIRLHAGEGIPRGSTAVVEGGGQLFPAFLAHLGISVETLRRLSTTHPGIRLRIGHGVGYLVSHPMVVAFRAQLKALKITFELNLSSNHTLLADNFISATSRYCDAAASLRRFLDLELPVVLSTDDDGVWPIANCRAHHTHVSLAAEYCRAIDLGAFTETAHIVAMIDRAFEERFGQLQQFSPKESVKKKQRENPE